MRSNRWQELVPALTASAVLGVAGVAKLGSLSDPASLESIAWIPREHAVSFRAGIALVELVTAVLLLRPATRRAGARLTVAAALAFTAFTLGLIRSGAPASCGCFGTLFSLQAPATLLLDLFLLACGGLLLGSRCLEPPHEERDWLHQPLPTSFFDRAAILAGVLTALFVWGSQVQWHERVSRGTESVTFGLHEGQLVPEMTFVDLAGQSVTAAELGQSWTLLTFTAPACAACRDEVAELAASREAWDGRLDDRIVVVGFRPSPRTAALYPYPADRLLFDPSGEAWRQVADQPARLPTSVVLGPPGVVRFVQSGREVGPFSLAADLRSHAEDTESAQLDPGLQNFWYGRRAPDGLLTLAGQECRLSELLADGPVLLSFVDQDCRVCDLATATIQEAADLLPGLRIVRIATSAAVTTASPPGWLEATDPDGALAVRYGASGRRRTFLLADGRLWYANTDRTAAGELRVAVRRLAERMGEPRMAFLTGPPRRPAELP